MITALLMSVTLATAPNLPPVKASAEFKNSRDATIQCFDEFERKSISRAKQACTTALGLAIADPNSTKEVRHVLADTLHFVTATDASVLANLGFTK